MTHIVPIFSIYRFILLLLLLLRDLFSRFRPFCITFFFVLILKIFTCFSVQCFCINENRISFVCFLFFNRLLEFYYIHFEVWLTYDSKYYRSSLVSLIHKKICSILANCTLHFSKCSSGCEMLIVLLLTNEQKNISNNKQ